jgi:Holliday junction resolvase RusA-like endonuclease
MTLRFTTLPPSTNNLYVNSGKRRFLNPKARAAKEAIGWEARAQYRGEPLEGPLAVKVALWWPDKRNHDIDNIKALLDALTGILWLDDGQINDLHITKGYDKAQPRVEMTIVAVEP